MSKKEEGLVTKIATFIVDKRYLFFLIFSLLTIFSVFSRNWVEVENELSAYLDEDTETSQGLDIMEEEFTTFGTADIMVNNISFVEGEDLADSIEEIDGVLAVDFDDSTEHYNNAASLLSITFDYDEEDEKSEEALHKVEKAISHYDFYIDTELGDSQVAIIDEEIGFISILVVIIIIFALLFTSKTYAEIPVLLITFGVAALISDGTNFFLGTISFVSNSVTVVLQLAMSIDYALIFLHRYLEEREEAPAREAVITSLSKAISEISASSMTTIGGLLAMTFMQYKIGLDMGIVLIKAIIISLLTVFTLMPGLLLLFSNLIDKTRHKNFLPDISFIGEFAYKTRKIVPPIFLIFIIAGFIFSSKVPYVYGYSKLTTPQLNDTQIAENMIKENFDSENPLAILVPKEDNETEKELLAELESYDEIDEAMGLANIEAMDEYALADSLSPREFSELIDLDYESVKFIYGAYAADHENYGRIVGGLDNFSVPLIDMFTFVHEQVDEGYVTLDEDTQETLDDAYEQMDTARQQLEGDNYNRLLVSLNLPEEGEETFEFLDTLHEIVDKYYEEDVYLVGESTSQYDLANAFDHDNTLVSILSALFVIAVLLFTFQSVGAPLLLILVIQGSIWLNFSFPYLTKSNLFFMSYLIVDSIQMGANIDYAVVVSSRYLELKEKMSRKDAIIETMNLAFPTLLTSGMILAIAGTLIGQLTSEPAIVGVGQNLGRGTIISLILVMFVLPQVLLLGDQIIERTSFTVRKKKSSTKKKGSMYVDGHVDGEISGRVVGNLRGKIHGEINGSIHTKDFQPEDGEIKDENNEENK